MISHILGIDPGTATTGFAILEVADNNKLKLIECGVITTSDRDPMPHRLQVIADDLDEIIKTHQPDWIVVEQLFFSTNARTAISVGQARGVALLAGARHKLSFAEYTPLQVKQAITGYGKATKKQVQQMVKTILQLNDVPKPDDAADAVAIAICHSASLKFIPKKH